MKRNTTKKPEIKYVRRNSDSIRIAKHYKPKVITCPQCGTQWEMHVMKKHANAANPPRRLSKKTPIPSEYDLRRKEMEAGRIPWD